MRTESLPAASPPDFPAAAKENEPFHIPPGIDEVVPPVLPGVTCDLPTVLHGVGVRMTQFVANLEKFSATEHIEHFRVDNADTLALASRAPSITSFWYRRIPTTDFNWMNIAMAAPIRANFPRASPPKHCP